MARATLKLLERNSKPKGNLNKKYFGQEKKKKKKNLEKNIHCVRRGAEISLDTSFFFPEV